jgi:hypothetical protein
MFDNRKYELIIEDQAFSPSYDFAPSPFPSTPSPPVNKLDQRNTGRLRKKDNLLMGEGEGVGEEPNHTKARKLGPL